MTLSNRPTNGDNNANTGEPRNVAVCSAMVAAKMAFFINMMFLVSFSPTDEERFLTTEQLLYCIFNSMSDEDTVNMSVIMAAIEKFFTDRLAVMLPSGKIKLTQRGIALAQSNNSHPVTEQDARRARGLCLHPHQHWILSTVANNGGRMDEAELERRFNAHFEVEAEVAEVEN